MMSRTWWWKSYREAHGAHQPESFPLCEEEDNKTQSSVKGAGREKTRQPELTWQISPTHTDILRAIILCLLSTARGLLLIPSPRRTKYLMTL